MKTTEKTSILLKENAKGTIGNLGLPGAPTAKFSLRISSSSNVVSGIVEITQKIGLPKIKINVVGTTTKSRYRSVDKIINLLGEYIVSAPAPAVGNYMEKFSAYLDIDDNCNGIGGFSFSKHNIDGVPVRSI